MKKMSGSYGQSVVAVVCLTFFLCSLSYPVMKAEALPEPDIKIKHKPISYFVPEKRIRIKAEIKDPTGIKLVRCYFRAVEVADYVFVTMMLKSSGHYEGILPAPSQDTAALEYLFLVVNENNQVVKTQVFRVEAEDDDDIPAWQEVGSEGQINVGSEVAQSTAEPLKGFSDSIAMDLVESSARFGIVAGLYPASQISTTGGVTGSAAAAQNAGTVAVSTGSSAAGWVIAGIGVAAIGGGVALALNQEDSKDEPSPPSPSPVEPTEPSPEENPCVTYKGTYRGSYSEVYCDDYPYGGSWSMVLREDCTARVAFESTSSVITLNFIGNSYTANDEDSSCGKVTYEGVMENNATMGSYRYSKGGSGEYSGSKR